LRPRDSACLVAPGAGTPIACLNDVHINRGTLMIATELRLPELGLVAGTRGMLGAGIGLLLADQWARRQFKIPLPASIVTGDRIWFRSSLIKFSRGRDEV